MANATGTTDIFTTLDNLEAAPMFDAYSKVVLHVDEDTDYISGNDDGRALEMTNPFGTQAMADAILASLSGYQYQPYQADGAELNPAAEIGDGANMYGMYGGIYTRSRDFGTMMKADISAPHDEEINHEYAFESPATREFTRQISEVRASLILTSQSILAEVVKQVDGDTESFGWVMDSSAHTWYANGNEVMKVSASGLEVNGKVTSTSGKIGGFTIGASSLNNNMPSLNSGNSTGVYIGTDGIKLGSGFKVTSGGVMSVSGSITLNGTAITAANLRSGAVGGNSYVGATTGSSGAPNNFYVKTLSATLIATQGLSVSLNNGGSFIVGSSTISKKSITVNGTLIKYLAWG